MSVCSFSTKIKKFVQCCAHLHREGVGHWAIYCTSSQSFMAQQLWGLLRILIGWFIQLSVQTFQPLIAI